MHGICGIYNKGNAPVLSEDIIRMRDITIGSSPDITGIRIGEHIGLGQRCLSIIGLPEATRQPMCNENGKIWIVIDGQIYDFKELREKLIKSGHIFKTETDSEVIVHGYEEWGEGVFEKINGAFAAAIWDSEKEALILARDRIGQEPLFYYESNGRVIFAFDIKSVLEGMGRKPEIDYQALDAFLCHLCVPHPMSIFKGIKKVSPAHYVIFSRNGTEIKKYWHLSFHQKIYMKEGEYLDNVEELLQNSIKNRLPNNGEVGVFLSGGIDSSLIVALASCLIKDKIKTFSIGFNYGLYNELDYAKKIADRYHTDHHTFILNVDSLNILPQLVWDYGEPFADSSAIPSYYVSKIAREYVKVALVGDGGDESFAGYNRIKRVYNALRYRKTVPQFMSKFFISPFFNIVGSSLDKFYLTNRIRLYENYLDVPIGVRYKNEMGCIGVRNELYSHRFKNILNGYDSSRIYEDYFNKEKGINEIDRALFVDINTILTDQYLVKMNIATTANLLETRAPFLDYRIVEFAAKIPSLVKLKRGTTKYLLKEITKKYIPNDSVNRPKWGFAIPIDVWFRKELKPYLYSIILSDKAKKRNYFNCRYVEYIINEHLVGKGYHEHKLWSLLWLELWHRMFIDNELKPANSLKDLI